MVLRRACWAPSVMLQGAGCMEGVRNKRQWQESIEDVVHQYAWILITAQCLQLMQSTCNNGRGSHGTTTVNAVCSVCFYMSVCLCLRQW